MSFCKAKYIIFLLICCTHVCCGQLLSSSYGSAAGFGVGQATAAYSDEHAAVNNQAGILGIDKWSFHLSAANLYGFSSLNVFSSSASRRINANSAVAISVKHIGDQDLNSQIIGIAYARKLLRNWDISLQFDVLSLQAKNFGNKYVPTVEIGSMVQATKQLRIGFHVFNPFSQALTDKEDVPAVIRLGVMYDLSKKVKMMAEVEKNLLLDLEIKAGIEYQVIDKFFLRAGVATGSSLIHMGLAYKFGNFAVHGASAFHSQLGFTNAGEVSFRN